MNKTVAIVGTHPDTRDNAPYDDLSIDIWAFNEVVGQGIIPRVTGLFQLHAPEIYRSPVNRCDPKHWEWLQQKHDFPIWMQKVDENVPSSVEYPLTEVLELQQGITPYLTNSVSYAIALAILKGYEKIMLYGIEMSSNTEYFYQRLSVGFWIGIALGHGLSVEMHSGKDIFIAPLYGYEGAIEQNISTFKKEIAQLAAKERKLNEKKMYWVQKVEKSYRNGKLSDNISKLLDTMTELGAASGEMQEWQRYTENLEKMTAAGQMAFIDRNEVEAAAGFRKKEIENSAGMVHRTAGVIDVIYSSYANGGKPDHLIEKLQESIQNHVNAGYNSGLHRGIWQCNHKIASNIDKLTRAAGGRKAVDYVTAGVN